MKIHKISTLVLLAVVMLASGIAYAELVQGEVTNVDLEGNALEVQKKDATTGATESLRISVSDTTAYSGEVTALAEMIEGDVVKIEADKDATSGNWVAKSVEVSAGE